MNNKEFKTLKRLRTAYLDGSAGTSDYWNSDDELDVYDRTFAQRIGWKWQYVLHELERFGWRPPEGAAITDWGCGSGIASRIVIEHFGADCFSELRLFDRSVRASAFAAAKSVGKFPELPAKAVNLPNIDCGTVVISHVITEIAPRQLKALTEHLRGAEVILWTEPGTYAASRALTAARESLRTEFNIVAPCLHSKVCGMLSPVNKRHWCHFFAQSPAEAYTERVWTQFAEKVGINLSDLPLSYLVLDKRRLSQNFKPDAIRIIARPHVTARDTAVLGCSAETVSEKIAYKSRLPDAWRIFKKGDFDSLAHWETNGREITGIDCL